MPFNSTKEVIQLEKYKGKDKIPGKPIRLNRQHLKIKNGKDYAEVVFFGDVHFGHPACRIDKARKMLEYCLKHKLYVFLMGDLIEFGTRYSVGASVYEQEANPDDQIDFMLDLLTPLAKEEDTEDEE